MGKDTFLGDQPPDPLQNRVGSVLEGRWTIERLIGAGGMAAVYRVTDSNGRTGAAKILHTSMARLEEVRARFMQEALAVSRLEHPAVVRVFDSGKADDGCPFLVMELLDGQSLAERIEIAPLGTEHALQLAIDLLDVLAVAHASHIIHRDIKPENIFLLPSGNIKLLDFGVARVRRHSVMHVVTQEGTALGTPHYMPQEQIKGVGVDQRADLFAVGAVLFELLTGRTVHEGHDYQALLVKMLTKPAPPLASVWAEAPPALCAVVDRALAFEADNRYPDAPSMLADVRALLAGQEPAQAPAPSPPPSTTSSTVAIDATYDPDDVEASLAVRALTAPDALAPDAEAIPAPELQGARPPAKPKPQQPKARSRGLWLGNRNLLLAAMVGGGLLAGIASAVVVAAAFGGGDESAVVDDEQDLAETSADEQRNDEQREDKRAGDRPTARGDAKAAKAGPAKKDTAPGAAASAAPAANNTPAPKGNAPGKQATPAAKPRPKKPSEHARDHIANQLKKARRKAREGFKWPAH